MGRPVQPSRRDGRIPTDILPSDESLGYYRTSLRDENVGKAKASALGYGLPSGASRSISAAMLRDVVLMQTFNQEKS